MTLLSAVVYGSVRLARYFKYDLGDFFLYHLTDLLFVLLVLSIILLLIRYVRKIKDFQFHWWQIVGLVVFYVGYFEYYLPTTSDQYTSDFVDILMYCLGGLLFLGMQMWERRKSQIALFS